MFSSPRKPAAPLMLWIARKISLSSQGRPRPLLHLEEQRFGGLEVLERLGRELREQVRIGYQARDLRKRTDRGGTPAIPLT
jgi:hypothetical protein